MGYRAAAMARLAASASLVLLCWGPVAALTAEVLPTKAGPALTVNGKRVAPLILFVNPASGDLDAASSTVRRARQAGVNIVSFVCHAFPWPKPGESADYSQWDSYVELILRANPDALLIPRIGMSNVPAWWAQQNPDELMLFDNGRRGMVSVASEKWRREAGDALALFVRHLEQKCGDHILGYHPCGQNTGEWFYDHGWDDWLPSFEPPMQEAFRGWLAAKYGGDSGLQQAWHDHKAAVGRVLPPSAEERRAGSGAFLNPVTQRPLTDFLAFQQDVMVAPLEHFAGIIKRETQRRKLVFYFYGYLFELSALPAGPAASGHLALERLLRCPDVDVICSPVSYFDRQPGGAGPFMAAVDSVQLNGKLWLNEDDTRTYLSRPEDGFGRAATLADTRSVHQRNFAQVATRGAALWWMDLPGAGWLDSAEIWTDLGRLRSLYERLLDSASPCRPEIAVVVDEESLLHLTANPALTKPLLYDLRRELYRIGAPVGFYLLSDVCAGRVEWPKMYVFLNAFSLSADQRKAIAARVAGPGKTAVWFYAPGYIEGDDMDPGLCRSLTGMYLKPSAGPGRAPAALTREGERFLPGLREGLAFGQEGDVNPRFTVGDSTAVPIARYDDGAVAVAARSRGGWTSIVVAVPYAPAEFFRAVAKKAGAHIFLDSDDVIAVGEGLLAIHASAAGTKSLKLPRPASIADALTGESLGRRSSLSLKMREGETRLLLLTPR